ncbi:catalase [Clostridium gasigenes]|uniref:catalase n=1 Tax=Clostridium gasigenes TaxID=94869 RepID=UPI001A9A8C9C|nr:catalase [Clostridium gasigenes]
MPERVVHAKGSGAHELYDTLSSGKNVEYEFFVQLMDPKIENDFSFNPIDSTKACKEFGDRVKGGLKL